jgi:hypothetical protein
MTKDEELRLAVRVFFDHFIDNYNYVNDEGKNYLPFYVACEIDEKREILFDVMERMRELSGAGIYKGMKHE